MARSRFTRQKNVITRKAQTRLTSGGQHLITTNWFYTKQVNWIVHVGYS